jgi:hypothetical protein
MSNTILIKRSGVAASIPGAGNLALGELAINYTDGNLFYKNNAGAVVVIASNQFLSVSGNVTANNGLFTNIVNTASFTGGQVSVTGNITGNYFLGNGSQLTGINASNVGTLTTLSVTGNATVGNLLTDGLISAGGNVTGNYILGNGAFLSGVITSVANINNGNSNVTVVSSGGNITVGVGGTSNVIVWATTGQYVNGLLSVSGNVTAANLNGNIFSTTISASGNVTGGNVSTAGNVNGANLNGNVFGTTVSVSGNVTGGNVSVTGGNISGANVVTVTTLSATSAVITDFSITGNVIGNLLPSANVTYNLGSSTAQWKDLFLSGNSINLGTQTISSDSAGVSVGAGDFSAGNLSADNTITAGTTISAAGNITAGNVSTAGNVEGANVVATTVSSTGNVVANNVMSTTVVNTASFTGGQVSVTGDVTANNGQFTTIVNTASFTGGLVSVTGNVTASNGIFTTIVNTASFTGGQVSVTGNIIGGNLNTSGLVSTSGNVQASNVNATLVVATTVSATGNVNGANINTNSIVGTTLTVTASTLNLSSTGNINLTPSGNIVLANTYINGVAYPAQNADAASKEYVDNLVSTSISYHEPVFAATNTTLETATGGTVTYAQPNGVANGVGATLTTTGAFFLIDTANVQTVGTRILVQTQANAVQNGIYTYANTTAIVRATDEDTYGAASATTLSINDYFFVESGNVNAGASFIVNAPAGTITFGTSNITFAEFSRSQAYTANTAAGLTLTGTVFSARVDNNTTAFDGLGNIIVKSSANLTTPNIGAATGTSLSVSGNVTANNGMFTNIVNVASHTGAVVSVSGNVTGGNLNTEGTASVATLIVATLANITATTISTSSITGAVVVAGGLGVAGNIYGGALYDNGTAVLTINSTVDGGTY